LRVQELLLSLHRTHIDVRWISAWSSSKHGGRMEMLVHCSVIYNVTTIVIVLNLMLMVRVVVASGDSSPSIILGDIRWLVHSMVRCWAHHTVALRVET
jgi:hypothetical protein